MPIWSFSESIIWVDASFCLVLLSNRNIYRLFMQILCRIISRLMSSFRLEYTYILPFVCMFQFTNNVHFMIRLFFDEGSRIGINVNELLFGQKYYASFVFSDFKILISIYNVEHRRLLFVVDGGKDFPKNLAGRCSKCSSNWKMMV